MSLTARLTTAGVLAIAGIASAANAELPGPIVRPGDRTALIKELSIGGFVNRKEPLAPCEPYRPVAFFETKQTQAFYAARFTVVRRGVGAWALVIRKPDGTVLWRR